MPSTKRNDRLPKFKRREKGADFMMEFFLEVKGNGVVAALGDD